MRWFVAGRLAAVGGLIRVRQHAFTAPSRRQSAPPEKRAPRLPHKEPVAVAVVLAHGRGRLSRARLAARP